jgi:hypothetical protein
VTDIYKSDGNLTRRDIMIDKILLDGTKVWMTRMQLREEGEDNFNICILSIHTRRPVRLMRIGRDSRDRSLIRYILLCHMICNDQDKTRH